MSLPRVLFLGEYDWANVSHRVAAGMNAFAGEAIARVAVVRRHPFGYGEDVVLCCAEAEAEVAALARDADWIISTGDGNYDVFLDLLQRFARLDHPRLATAHVGSAYRRDRGWFDTRDGALGFKVRFMASDLWRHLTCGPRDVPYFAPPGNVSFEGFIAPLDFGAPVRIGHSPTNRALKGTHEILEVMNEVQLSRGANAVEVDLIEGVQYAEARARRGRCHIFVDQLNPKIGGYGASATEAMAAGAAVLADMRHVEGASDGFYARPPIISVLDVEALWRRLDALVQDRYYLASVRVASLAWARTTASPWAVGDYWLRHLAAAGV